MPATVGVKLMLILQSAPGASTKLLLQSGGVPEPTTWEKLGTVKANPGATASSGMLPTFSTVTARGLSPLVLPTAVEAKGNAVVVTSTLRMRLLP